MDPLVAASAAFTSRRPDVVITWAARSLREFEDVPLAELTSSFDLIALDHPFVGQGSASGLLVPLDEVLGEDVLADQLHNSVGASFGSYRYGGRQWALPVDAAAQVCAYRPDLLAGPPPASWDEVVDLLRWLSPGTSAQLPANPTHLWSSFLTLCEHHAITQHPLPTGSDVPDQPSWWTENGIEQSVAVAALEFLRRLLSLVDPVSLNRDPIQTLDDMAAGAPVAYAPMIFGYVTYALARTDAHLVRFADIPSPGRQQAGSLLGGVGLAASAARPDVDDAVEFIAWAVSAECQAGVYAQAGGQPGHRAAWLDDQVNLDANAFFRDTLNTLDASFVRPRRPEYPAYQRQAAELLHHAIRTGTAPKEIAAELSELWVR